MRPRCGTMNITDADTRSGRMRKKDRKLHMVDVQHAGGIETRGGRHRQDTPRAVGAGTPGLAAPATADTDAKAERQGQGRGRRGGQRPNDGATGQRAEPLGAGAAPSPSPSITAAAVTVAMEGRTIQVLDDALLAEQDALIRAEREMRLARYAQLQSARVISPAFTRTMAALERCYEMQPIRKEPPCASLVGPKGCGKTTIAESLCERHPSIKTKTGIERPVVYCVVPPNATYSMLVSELLKVMGDPRYDKDSITSRTGRLRDALRDCKTRIVILDEINHFVYAKDANVLRAGADWLKNLIKHPDTKVSVILVGLEDEFTALVEANKGQLAHFFPDPHRFAPYAWDPKVRDQDQDLYIFLEQLEVLLPFEERGYLANPDTAWRIYCASHGTLRYVMMLIRRAGEITIDAGKRHPHRQEFAQAFDEELAGNRRRVPNPFKDEARPELAAKPLDVDNDLSQPQESRGGLGRHGRRTRAPRRETVQSIIPRRGR